MSKQKKYDIVTLRQAWAAGRMSATREPEDYWEKIVWAWALRQTDNQPWPFYSEKRWAGMCIRMAEWVRTGRIPSHHLADYAKLGFTGNSSYQEMSQPAWWGRHYFGRGMREQVAERIGSGETPLQCLQRLEDDEAARECGK